MSGNPNDHDPNRQGDLNRQDPRDPRDSRDPWDPRATQWNNPDDQASYPLHSIRQLPTLRHLTRTVPTNIPLPHNTRHHSIPPSARKIPTVSHLRRVLIAPMHMDPRQDKGLTRQQLPDSGRPLHAGTVGAGRFVARDSRPRQMDDAATVFDSTKTVCLLRSLRKPKPLCLPTPPTLIYDLDKMDQDQGGRGGPPVLYGAHGQPLPPQQQPQGPETTLPPPQGMYYQNGRPPMDGAPLPLASTMPDPRHRRGSNSGFEYPDPTNLAPVTPAGSAPGYQTHTTPSPYAYPPPPAHDRRTSPPSAYNYDARPSSSPHGSPFPPMQAHQAPMTPHQGSVPPVSAQQGSAPLKSSGTPQPGGVTPPPSSTPGGSQRGGLNVRDMLNPGDSQGRSSTDSDMLNALNRRGPQ
ncbi:hypothetical protein N7516_006534 [Penicillium verrucosum]|uniref:uncharacterized protein n=1 Tax=Penicillium verrucosum TaxID=60171 RepID=UPI002544E975|nr:uncharacterized protein N7516_006534 [Penicillium verrucosum]KAJ5932045.1 hypothetical protein N7516_006534 [Penicillium verrucosum]